MSSTLKSSRGFLESSKHSNNYYYINVSDYDGVELTLADCNRNITWWLGKKGSKRGKAKIAKIKKAVDSIYDYLHEEA